MQRILILFILMTGLAFGPVYRAHAQETEAVLEAARAFYDQGDLEAALREVEAALRVNKKNPRAHYWKGMIALRQGDLKTAEKAFQTARSQDKGFAEAYNGLGNVFRQKKNRKMDAIEAYQQALRLNPAYAEAQYNLGSLYRDLSFGDIAPLGLLKPLYLRKGIEALERTLEIDPNHPQANNDLGLLYETGMSNVEKAMTYYTRQLETNPEHTESLDRLGRGFFKTGQYGEGVATLNRLVKQYPRIKDKVQPTLTMLEAALHLKNGAYDRAQATFESFILSLPPEEQAVYDDIALVASAEEGERYAGLPPEQKAEYRRQFWQRRDADPTTTPNERLIEHYRRVLFSRIHFGEALFPWDRRGEIYVRYGDPDDRQTFTFSVGEKQETNQGSMRSTGPPTVQELGDAIRESAQSHVLERHTYAPTGNARVDAIREMNFQQRFQLAVEASTIGLSAYRAESWVYVPMGAELFFVDQLHNGRFDFPLITQSRDVRQMARQAEYHPARLAEEMIRRAPETYYHNFGGELLTFFYDVVSYQGEGSRSEVEVAVAVPVYQLGAQVDGQGKETTLNARVAMLDEAWREAGQTATAFGPFPRPAFFQSRDAGTTMATFQVPLSLFPGDGELAVAVKDAATQKIGIYRQPVAISSYTAPTLLMSDIKQASSITPTIHKRGTFIRRGYEIIPNPTHIFARNQPVHIYYELYNLRMGEDGRTRFQTDITVSAREETRNLFWRIVSGFGRLIAGSSPDNVLTFRIEDASDSTTTVRYTALDVSGSVPGRYTIEVRVTDLLASQTVARTTELLVTKEAATEPSVVPATDAEAPTGATEPPDAGAGMAAPEPSGDPATSPATANPAWNDLLRMLQTPGYAMASSDSMQAAVDDSAVTAYVAGIGERVNTYAPPGGGADGDTFADMVYVPAGMFLMGSDSSQADEGPFQNIYVGAFYIDRYEVTNEAYKRFIDATGHPAPKHWFGGTFPPGEARCPVAGVSWYDARAYAEWMGKRLPTEAEWEKAARGDDGRTYPWGDAFVPNWLNVNGEGDAYPQAAPVGSFAQGVSPYGVYDMAGNVEEWTADWFDRYPSNTRDDPAYGQQYRVTRGGSWINYDGNTRTFNRGKFYPSDTSILLGFRCARDAQGREADAAVAGYGYLLIATPGAWADIYVDDERLGQTPQADPLRLRPGTHTLRLVNPYFQTYEQTVEVPAGSVRKERVVLVRKGAP
jgi:iron(II)-dependent oxidoreductase